MRCHAAQRLPNLRSACGHEDLLPRDVSIAVLAPVEKERDQEQFDPVSQRSRKRNPSEQADEMAGHTSGEIHDGPIEASIAAPAWRQQVAPLAKSGRVDQGRC